MFPQQVLEIIPPNSQMLLWNVVGGDKFLGPVHLYLLTNCLDEFYTGVTPDVSFDGRQWCRRCIRKAKIILDFTWEKLNTGYWKDVNICWRYAYTVATFVKCLSEFCEFIELNEKYRCDELNNYNADENKRFLNEVEAKFGGIMRTLDMGLLMGAPVLDNILARTAKVIQPIYFNVMKSLGENSTVQRNKTDNSKDSCESYEIKKMKLADNDSTTETNINQTDLILKNTVNPGCNNIEECISRLYGDTRLNSQKHVSITLCPSMEDFRDKFMRTQKSVVIKNAVDYWPAFTSRKWSVEYIKNIAGLRTVPIEIGSKYTDESWSQKLMTISEFIDKYIDSGRKNTGENDDHNTSENVLEMNNETVMDQKPSPVGYLAQYQLFDQIPELRDDIDIPTYCCHGNNEDVDINAWFGPRGTISPLHYDPKHNFLVQVVGCKYVRLYSDAESSKLYPHDDMMLFNTSQVDLLYPDTDNFPDFPDAAYTECIIKPGDMLYIPPKHWHYVESLSTSFSVSFWWQ